MYFDTKSTLKNNRNHTIKFPSHLHIKIKYNIRLLVLGFPNILSSIKNNSPAENS